MTTDRVIKLADMIPENVIRCLGTPPVGVVVRHTGGVYRVTGWLTEAHDGTWVWCERADAAYLAVVDVESGQVCAPVPVGEQKMIGMVDWTSRQFIDAADDALDLVGSRAVVPAGLNVPTGTSVRVG